jgi:hypothetical protein
MPASMAYAAELRLRRIFLTPTRNMMEVCMIDLCPGDT